MPLVTLKAGQMPRDIDGFPEKAKRSVKGALYLTPGAYKQVTDDELTFAKSLLGDVFHIAEEPFKAADPGTAVAAEALSTEAVEASQAKPQNVDVAAKKKA